MRSSLGRATPYDFVKDVTLSRKLAQLLAQGFIDLDGAIIFTSMQPIAENVGPEKFPDLTGFECFVNHIHVEDELEGAKPSQTMLLKQGVAFGLAIENQLHSTFPGKSFRVIVAATGNACGARFHLMRGGEEWLTSNLDGYEEEAVLVLEDDSILLSC